MADIGTDILNAINKVQTSTDQTRVLTSTMLALQQTAFVSLSNGLAKLVDEQSETNSLLNFERQQNETIICWLSTIGNVLCQIVHQMNTANTLQATMNDSLGQIRQTLELVHGSETIEVLRRRDLEKRIAECCPERIPDPPPCFEPCKKPDYKPYDPKVPKYDPLVVSKP